MSRSAGDAALNDDVADLDMVNGADPAGNLSRESADTGDGAGRVG
jgi:hypothetical protein